MRVRSDNVLSGSFGKALGIQDRSCDFAGVRFDSDTGVLANADSVYKLEPKAADVLALLCRERGTLVTRQRLLDECWGEGTGSDEALTQVIAQIRRSLEALHAPRNVLTTYPKRGYCLAASSPPAERPHRRRLPGSMWIMLALVAAAIIASLAFRPHWARHMIRHALGLGPNHSQYH